MEVDMSLPKPQRILLAAEQVFSMYGFEKAILDEIIAIADVGKGTLYKYYGNKEQLFFRLVEEKNQVFTARLQKSVDEVCGIEAKLLAYFRELVSFYRRNSRLWQIIFFEMLNAKGRYIIMENNGDPYLVSRYDGMQTEKGEKELLLRYYEIIAQEFRIFREIIDTGIREKYLKNGNIDISCRFIFFGVVMSIFNPVGSREDELTPEEAAECIVDRYLNGERILFE